jgi:hypothetical protein
VRVFGATAVKGDSARFAVAQQAQQVSQQQPPPKDYKTVTDEKYASKMAQEKGGGVRQQQQGMYTAPVPPPPAAGEDSSVLSPMQVAARQASFQETRLSSIDAIVSQTQGKAEDDEPETSTF